MAESWESRMAARAQDRAAIRQVVERAQDARDWDAHTAQLERLGMSSRAGMTLGEAVTLLNAERWVCACVGPPLCCRYSFVQAEALHRAAHIAAKLLLDASAPGEADHA